VGAAVSPTVVTNEDLRTTAPACSLDGLALDYVGGGGATGNDFGTIRLRDVGASACLLEGPIIVAGIDAAGRVVTQTLSDPVAEGLVLTPGTPRRRPGQVAPRGETVADLRLIAPYRDDPTSVDGLCLNHEVVPVQWRVALGDRTKLVRNAGYDRHNPTNEFSSLVTCRGRLGPPIIVRADAT
jgi:hypothetical protein